MLTPLGTLHNLSQSWNWPLGRHLHRAIFILSFEALRLGFLNELTYLLFCDPTMLPHLLELFKGDLLTLLKGGICQSC